MKEMQLILHDIAFGSYNSIRKDRQVRLCYTNFFFLQQLFASALKDTFIASTCSHDKVTLYIINKQLILNH